MIWLPDSTYVWPEVKQEKSDTKAQSDVERGQYTYDRDYKWKEANPLEIIRKAKITFESLQNVSGDLEDELSRACKEYGSLYEENSTERFILEMLRFCIFQKPDDIIQDDFIECILRYRPVPEEVKAKLLRNLIMEETIGEFRAVYAKEGGTPEMANYMCGMIMQIKTLKSTEEVKAWRVTIQKDAEEMRWMNKYDREFKDWLCSSYIACEDKLVSMALTMYVTTKDCRQRDLVSWMDDPAFKSGVQTSLFQVVRDEKSDQSILNFADTIYGIVNDPLFAVHIIDLLRVWKGGLEEQMRVACLRYMEFLFYMITDKDTTVRDEIGAAYRKYLPENFGKQTHNTFYQSERSGMKSNKQVLDEVFEFITEKLELPDWLGCKEYGQ